MSKRDSRNPSRRFSRAGYNGLMKRAFATLAVSILLSSCATVVEGINQQISVVTNPPGASCELDRQGQVIGRISDTPDMVKIRKNKFELTIRCRKQGYREVVYIDRAGGSSQRTVSAVMDLWIPVGFLSAIDSADGADDKYEGWVTLVLVPETNAAPTPTLPPVTPALSKPTGS